jgi:hypothetical protein
VAHWHDDTWLCTFCKKNLYPASNIYLLNREFDNVTILQKSPRSFANKPLQITLGKFNREPKTEPKEPEPKLKELEPKSWVSSSVPVS